MLSKIKLENFGPLKQLKALQNNKLPKLIEMR